MRATWRNNNGMAWQLHGNLFNYILNLSVERSMHGPWKTRLKPKRTIGLLIHQWTMVFTVSIQKTESWAPYVLQPVTIMYRFHGLYCVTHLVRNTKMSPNGIWVAQCSLHYRPTPTTESTCDWQSIRDVYRTACDLIVLLMWDLQLTYKTCWVVLRVYSANSSWKLYQLDIMAWLVVSSLTTSAGHWRNVISWWPYVSICWGKKDVTVVIDCVMENHSYQLP